MQETNFNKHITTLKNINVNIKRLLVDQLVNVLFTIDKTHTILETALNYGPDQGDNKFSW